jgi:hypothetical protein
VESLTAGLAVRGREPMRFEGDVRRKAQKK